jgi:hypothetical protein
MGSSSPTRATATSVPDERKEPARHEWQRSRAAGPARHGAATDDLGPLANVVGAEAVTTARNAFADGTLARRGTHRDACAGAVNR